MTNNRQPLPIQRHLIDLVSNLDKQNPDKFTDNQLSRVYSFLYSIFNSKEEYAQDVIRLEKTMTKSNAWNKSMLRNPVIRQKMWDIVAEGAY